MVYETTTKLNWEKVKKKAIDHFGKELGLTEVKNEGTCLDFEGGGGFVNIYFCIQENDEKKVELTTREWDRQVKSFMGKI